MEARIALISIVTDQFQEMRRFYHEVLGFPVKLDLEQYVEFESEGVRFAITTADVMQSTTGDSSFEKRKEGQSFELAFPVSIPAEVDSSYQELLEKGATPIKGPENKPWGQRAAFFADPDNNIHEIFADLPGETSSMN